MDAGIHASPAFHRGEEKGDLVEIGDCAIFFQGADETGDLRIHIFGLGFIRCDDRRLIAFPGGADSLVGDSVGYARSIARAPVGGVDEARAEIYDGLP